MGPLLLFGLAATGVIGILYAGKKLGGSSSGPGPGRVRVPLADLTADSPLGKVKVNGNPNDVATIRLTGKDSQGNLVGVVERVEGPVGAIAPPVTVPVTFSPNSVLA